MAPLLVLSSSRESLGILPVARARLLAARQDCVRSRGPSRREKGARVVKATVYEVRPFTATHAVPGLVVLGIARAVLAASLLAPTYPAVEVVAEGECVAAWVDGEFVEDGVAEPSGAAS